MNRPEPWENPAPDSHHFEPHVVVSGWQLGHTDGKRCRWTDHGQRCPNAAIARLDRASSYSRHPIWWAYCADHLNGRWIEGDLIWEWRLVENRP